jgi:hypothetical protein
VSYTPRGWRKQMKTIVAGGRASLSGSPATHTYCGLQGLAATGVSAASSQSAYTGYSAVLAKYVERLMTH